jgi:uncharacterized membrane protein
VSEPASPFWLSHHAPEELHRAYRVGRLHVCARCLGLYPVLLAALVIQFASRAPLSWRADGWIAIPLFLPALADWASGRFFPALGTNVWRTVTGALLGVALGRTLYIHLQQPWPQWLILQVAIVTAVATPVILATYKRRRGK